VIITSPFTIGAWTREQIDNLSRGWCVLLVTGVISVLAGGARLFTDWTVEGLAPFELRHMSVRRNTVAGNAGARQRWQPRDVATMG
jgi:hypothetical protein